MKSPPSKMGMRWHGFATLAAACAAGWGGCSIDARSLTVHDAGAQAETGASPPSLVIATFEKGTAQPDDPRFRPFQYYPYPQPASAESALTSPLAAPGHNSNYAVGLNWVIFDTPNGKQDFPGVGLRTLVNGSIDLSGYSRIVFGLKYAPTPDGFGFPDSSACLAVPSLTVSIACNEHNTSFQKNVPMPADWTTATVSFADFREPSYLPATTTTIEDCLAVVDSIYFQAQVDLRDGECAAGALLLDDLSVRPPVETDAGADGGGTPSTGIVLTPDANGAFDGSNAAGVVGSWWSAGDYFGNDGTPGAGYCPTAGFPMASCSALNAPTPGSPFRPDPLGRMCTSGIAAQVVNGSDGMPAWSSIYGNNIGFDLVDPGTDRWTSPVPYDSVAHGITGFAFDIDAVPAGGHLRVELATTETRRDPAYWAGATDDLSPILAPGHYEMRWRDIGGPKYLGAAAPPFDATKLKWIQFHVASNNLAPIPYAFCISKPTLLTN